jgi:hypothetical protein
LPMSSRPFEIQGAICRRQQMSNVVSGLTVPRAATIVG